jgi:hypothetical protein
VTRPHQLPNRVYVVKLHSCRTEADNIRALKQILKRLLRSFQMRCVSVHEEHQRNLEFPQQRESSPDKHPVNRELISNEQ